MRMHATHERSTDGRPVIKVRFEQATPEADAPVIEVVYLIQWPQDFTIMDDSIVVLVFLTCTRTDTREKIELQPDEGVAVLECATQHGASVTRGG